MRWQRNDAAGIAARRHKRVTDPHHDARHNAVSRVISPEISAASKPGCPAVGAQTGPHCFGYVPTTTKTDQIEQKNMLPSWPHDTTDESLLADETGIFSRRTSS